MRLAGLLLPTVLLSLAFVAPSLAEERTAPRLRMVHVDDGLREAVPDGDLGKVDQLPIAKEAAKSGVDLEAEHAPLLVHAYANGRLFYVFYKTVEGAVGDRPYVIQRIKKTVRDWKPGAAQPDEQVTWQVEVFKTIAGALKRADQHYGSFGIGDRARREIVKEYEIGIGEVPGVCEGRTWPFPDDSLFRFLQRYQPARGLYDAVRFAVSRRWTLTVSLDRQGGYRVASPELGFDAPERSPPAEAAAFLPDPRSKDLVLTAGQGVKALRVGRSRAEELERDLGPSHEILEVGRGHRNHATPFGLTVNVRPDGVLNTIITRTDFAGRTARGIRIGSPRWEVLKTYGPPRQTPADAPHWRYPGIVFYFDGFERVQRMVVFAP